MARRSGDSPSLRDGDRASPRAGRTHARSPLGRLTGSSRPAGAGGTPAPIAGDRPLKAHFTKNGCAVRSAYIMLGRLSTTSTSGGYSLRLGYCDRPDRPLSAPGGRPGDRGRERVRTTARSGAANGSDGLHASTDGRADADLPTDAHAVG